MVLDSASVAGNAARVLERLAAAVERAGRPRGSVRLVGATKTVPAAALRAAYEAGITEFGENYVQELREKKGAAPDATWHFIGTLQASSAHHVAELADVVQTLVPGKATARLARRAAEAGRTIPSLIEVDFTGERTGVAPQACESFADDVADLGGLSLVGLMTIPPAAPTAEEARPYFARLRDLRDRVRGAHPGAVELSMGMSLDYEVAVQEGATIVRVGTAVFGERARA
jgi:pyridoxal phosphate enzyme (YggS family)